MGSKSTARVDKFLVTHIRSLAGAVKILQANNLHVVFNNSKDSDDDIDLKSNVRSITSNTTINNSDSSINDSIDTSTDFKIISNKNEIKYDTDISAPIDNNTIDSDNNIEDTNANSISFTYLNKVENWKGKNNSPKNRGKYLTVCPDVENIHLKPKFTTTVPLLKNGCTLGFLGKVLLCLSIRALSMQLFKLY